MFYCIEVSAGQRWFTWMQYLQVVQSNLRSLNKKVYLYKMIQSDFSVLALFFVSFESFFIELWIN